MLAVPPLGVNSSKNIAVPAGQMLTLSCTSHSSNPAVSFVWKEGSTEELDSSLINSASSSGQYGGVLVTSTLSLLGSSWRSGQNMTCIPQYLDQPLVDLQRLFTLNITSKYFSVCVQLDVVIVYYMSLNYYQHIHRRMGVMLHAFNNTWTNHTQIYRDCYE